MRHYQRVYIPLGDGWELYGFVRVSADGELELTYCCSLTPLVWVEGIQAFRSDGNEEEADGFDGSGYYSVQTVRAAQHGPIDHFSDIADFEDAREHFQGNW